MIKVGIIGSGFGQYGLLPAFHALPNCQVVAFCGKQTPRLLNTIKQLSLEGTLSLYENWQEMLDCKQLGAVAIAVPPHAQYAIVKKALEKNLHIFAEKPLTAQLTHAYELTEIAARKNVTHAIDFLFPEIDVWQAAKQILDEKRFGEIRHVTVNWDFRSFDIRQKISSWKTDSTLGGGALSFYFSHVLYYLEYFVGTIANLKSRFSHSPNSLNGGEVGVELDLEFSSGAKGAARISCDSDLVRHQLIFTCESGEILLENRQNITEQFFLKTTDKQGSEMVISSQDLTPNKGADKDERVIIVKRLAQKFVDACLANQQMSPSFVQGVRVQELIEQARNERYS
ncbi:MAG TPA: Gfo/Idh/MocA family oxidoreductase [Rhabdochlamydiaceae bacterium]|jgi:predicted dehydrogenase|nr:Gfo/Idh/MocA family oxidoreductase [Rhabdochlamydiaceae bacterium]